MRLEVDTELDSVEDLKDAVSTLNEAIRLRSAESLSSPASDEAPSIFSLFDEAPSQPSNDIPSASISGQPEHNPISFDDSDEKSDEESQEDNEETPQITIIDY